MHPRRVIGLTTFLLAGITIHAVAQGGAAPGKPDLGAMTLYPAGKVDWKPGPATLPKGVLMAVLEGDPTKPGLFTLRFKFPAGLKVMPHYHSQTEHATVLAGVLHIGMGDAFMEGATEALPAGSFGYWPAGTRHFAWMEGEVILQLHGQGPWTVTYVNPRDDPRKPAP